MVPVEDQQNYGEVVGVTEQPAPASGVVVGVLTEQPAPVSGVVVGVVTEQPGASSGGAARGGLDADKWAGRPPPPAPEELYTGPRSDGLLSTDEISGEYSAPDCSDMQICNSMTVVPLGADVIETWRTGCCFLPPLMIAPIAQGWVWTRKPGTNAFLNGQRAAPMHFSTTFSADGTAKQGCGSYKKRPGSQKRTFQKVDARDLAGDWRGCCCIPLIWYGTCLLSPILCTTKKALNEDRYEESGLCFVLGLPCPVETTTRTRKYVNGHATNGFAKDGAADPNDVHWHRDPGCAAGLLFFAKKVG